MHIIWWILLGIAYILVGIIVIKILEKTMVEDKAEGLVLFALSIFFPLVLIITIIQKGFNEIDKLFSDLVKQIFDNIENKKKR